MKNQIIKIPNFVTVFYCNKNKILVFINDRKKQTRFFQCQILFSKQLKLFKIVDYSSLAVSKDVKKKLKVIKGISFSYSNQFIFDSSKIVRKKLNLVGVGYKVLVSKKSFGSVLQLKLGYSHSIFIKIPLNIIVLNVKSMSLLIIGFCFYDVTRFASIVRSCKFPEPYKGKGVLFENEKIIIKQGKKI